MGATGEECGMEHGAREIETTWASPERSSRAASRYWESAKIPWSYDLTEPEMQIERAATGKNSYRCFVAGLDSSEISLLREIAT